MAREERRLVVGRRDATSDPAAVRGDKLNRHTFWCGQSGSGKTYSLGVLLEQILLETALPMVVLDPNGDFVQLRSPRPDADPAEAAALTALDVRVRSGDPVAGEPLRVRFTGLPTAARAATLRLDPLLDAVEYQAARRLTRSGDLQDMEWVRRVLAESEDPSLRQLAMRVLNLELLDWDIWASRDRAVEDDLDERPAALVLDLGHFARPEEPAAVGLAVLEHLWARRHERRPILIVIDEAHTICPEQPTTPLQRALTERVGQIAAEGRKFGLWLLLSTQRPNRISRLVLSQCDNLGLLRMNSTADLDDIEQVFGMAPPPLVRASMGFRQGQLLMAGPFVEEPLLVQTRDRISLEGGSDVAVPLGPRTAHR